MKGMIDLQRRQIKIEEKRGQDADRAKCKKDTKPPTPLVAKQPVQYLTQMMVFEQEARDSQKKGRELWELFRTATKDERAGFHLKAIMEEPQGKMMVKMIAAHDKQPDKQEAMYERLYSWARLLIYMRMGGKDHSIKQIV